MPKDHIILYGGSFNPPHFSHLLFVAALGGCFPEAEIWVAPTYAHAFGKPLMDYELRLRMLEAMFAPYRHVVVSTIERDLHRSTSYTVDVVRAILAQCPGVRVSVAVGADIVPTLLQWREYDVLREISDFIVFPREGYDNTGTVPMPILPGLSSTEIRAIMAENKDDPRLEAMIPASALAILRKA
ncbi:MAG: nicotinate-nicotinamide nucleotide adenylyltransferase [Proteobacteria bacterium]|nr:nicotinate-nicotinamide nucleotide adenylyltransferase [Pseudomonadota bacterium]MBQ4361064.1 nicotinate-nicotinamide nucleotide adenylyltransferase [Pseudomonadota bacterium]